MSVRKALGAALLGMWGLLSGCSSFLSDRNGAYELFQKYESSLENRARMRLREDSMLAQMNYAASDPLLAKMYDNEQDRDRARHEVVHVARNALTDTMQAFVRGNVGRTFADVLTPTPSLEDVTYAPGLPNDPSIEPVQMAPAEKAAGGKFISPKIGPGTHHVKARVEILRIASAGVDTKYNGEIEKAEARLRWRILDDIVVSGKFENDFENRERKWVAGLHYRNWGTWIEVLPDGEKQIWFGYGY
ncbi:MAG TPA: hypothetical protein VLJ21_04335 [Candidatus Binatia bacterium]|nr:hypothetical protein [Candidatus Binatia bacterium]